jgi:citrate lyase subunit beta/citryl-CoA lyase
MATEVAAKDNAVPIRSLVHVGASEAALSLALSEGADALFFDLEEPQVPYGPSAKKRARAMVGEYLAASAAGHPSTRSFVRVHGPATGETIRDLDAVLTPALTGVMLPKTCGPEDVLRLDGVLTSMEFEKGLPLGSTQVLPLLETAQSIRLAYEIAAASDRVTYMGGMVSRFGDVHQSIGYRWTPAGAESHYLTSKVLIDARAAGIKYPISGAWGGDTDDEDGMRRWAETLRDLGYFGMLVMPSGVKVAHEVFSPSEADVAFWEQLVDLSERAAGSDGDSPIRYEMQTESGDKTSRQDDLHEAYIGSARKNLEWARQLGYEK